MTLFLVTILIFLSIFGAGFAYRMAVLIKNRKRRLALAAEKYRLECKRQDRTQPFRICGSLDNYEITVFYDKVLNSISLEPAVVLEVKHNSEFDFSLYVSARWAFRYTDTDSSPRYLKSGDDMLDSKVYITSNDISSASCLLHPKVRGILADEIAQHKLARFRCDSGIIQFHYLGWNDFSGDSFGQTFSRLKPLLELLSRKGSRIDLLKENYVAEERDEAKLVFFKALFRLNWNPGKTAKRDPIIKDALHSGNSEFQFRAIQLMGHEGKAELIKRFPGAHGFIQCEMLEYAVRRQWKDLRIFFSGQFTSLKTAKAIEAWLDYFSVAADTSFEKIFHTILDSGKIPENVEKNKIVYVLGKCGTYPSIGRLHAMKDHVNPRIVDQAIAGIQNRIGVGDAGWLSVQKAEKTEGMLALEDKDGVE
jgi:hypothetical protein